MAPKTTSMKFSLRRGREIVAAARERLQASPWSKAAFRVALAMIAVVALACLGKSVATGDAVSPAAAAVQSAPAVTSAPAPNALPPMVAIAAIEAVDASTSVSPTLPAHTARASPDDPVFLNEATIDDLQRLPSVGQKRALAILELRGKLGKLHQIEDLLRVKGIGRSTLKKLRPLVRLDHADAGK